jgi:hypothetical protein
MTGSLTCYEQDEQDAAGSSAPSAGPPPSSPPLLSSPTEWDAGTTAAMSAETTAETGA